MFHSKRPNRAPHLMGSTELNPALLALLTRWGFKPHGGTGFTWRVASPVLGEKNFLATSTGGRQLFLSQGHRVIVRANVVTADALEQILTTELGTPPATPTA
jgi:hypothetical protein